jgi:hypothetical protein
VPLVLRRYRVHRISPNVRDDGQRPLWRETGGNLPVILGTDQPLTPATDWHDGQISRDREVRVN